MKSIEEVKYDESLQPRKKDVEKPSNLRIFIPRIDTKKCEKNYRCFVYCPHDAVDIRKDGFPSIDPIKCTGCLLCLRECPTSAITEERE